MRLHVCFPPAARFGALALALAFVLPAPGRGQVIRTEREIEFDPVIDSPMYRDPELPPERIIRIFPKETLALWLRALERPEVEMRCRVAEALVQARARGAEGLGAAVAPLRAALTRPDQHPDVVRSVARALVALDERAAAADLFEAARRGGADVREVVEPALARWDFAPARAVWQARLDDAATSPRLLVLAARGLGAARADSAVARLSALAHDATQPATVRLEAARALGQIRAAGLEDEARTLARDPAPRGLVGRLAAASLLKRHDSPAAVQLLQSLARDSEPAVVAAAAGRLLEIDPSHLLPLLEPLLASTDAGVRAAGVEVASRRPTPARVGLLCARLADTHPSVRRQARRALRELARAGELRQAILDGAAAVLAGREWRGLEQSAILLAQLGHTPAGPRLVALLVHDRPEVMLAAAWSLRTLDSPATLPGVLRHVESVLDRQLKPPQGTKARPLGVAFDHQLGQLNQFLGRRLYRPAEPALRRFVPKEVEKLGPEGRGSAIWALGLFHADEEARAPADLVAALLGRINDTPPPPEMPVVRRMAAISLGRIKAAKALPTLEKYGDLSSPLAFNNPFSWALSRLTGRPLPPPPTSRRPDRDWFLAPNE